MSGGRISYFQTDVSDRKQVDRCVQAALERFGQIHGVIHAAGIIRDGFLRNKEWHEAISVISPKLQGVVNLDEATAGQTLDFFVAFSSMAGVAGNIGQADYAFANAFLDRFIGERARRGGSGVSLSINWPLWEKGGMRLDREMASLKAPQAVALDDVTGLKIFETALCSTEPQVAVLLRRIERNPYAVIGAENSFRPSDTTALLKQRFSQLTKIPVARLQSHEPLERYGMDSILVLTFTQQLERDFGPLSKTLLFEYQTLDALAGYFAAHHAGHLRILLGVPSLPGPGAATQSIPATVPALHRPVAEDEIAITGLFGRFPKAESPAEFWRNLVAGRDCITEVPAERWDYRQYLEAKPCQSGKTYNKWGGFLDDVDKFDAAFFKIPPREAEMIDPQERLFLENVWRTLEDAGYRKSALRSKRVGVFVGVMYGHYQLFGIEDSKSGDLVCLNSSYASIANRISYFFDWHGPSMAVDTMCSSSLTAIHLACDSIRKGESELAVAGGVNLSLHPVKDVGLAQGNFASPDGRCKSFGAGGEGYVPGEGVGSVLLKPLRQALADGDHVYAVIKATAVNHGGKTNGYTVPNPSAQANVIAEALRKGSIDPRTVTYLEAHGTGTSLGDPIEITGLTQAFDAVRREFGGGEPIRPSCAIGSAKSNIGHLEAAAGIAGLTKVLMQMQHRTLVPSLHSQTLNPHIPFGETPFGVQQVVGPWNGNTPRRAGISSFGAGGANAHLIVEEFIAPERAALDRGPFLILLSALTDERLSVVASNLLGWVTALGSESANRPSLAEVSFTLQVGREPLEERLAFTVSNWEELKQRLEGFLNHDASIEFYRGNTRQDRGAAALLLDGEDGQEFLAGLMRKRNLAKLAQFWTSGVNIDWETIWGDKKPRRASLPVYPFAKFRCWAPKPLGLPGAKEAERRLHPLLHRNNSTLKEQVYSSSFNGDERVFRDHQVAGERMFPGAASLELVLAGVRLASESDTARLRDIMWERAVTVGASGVELKLALRADKSGAVGLRLLDGAGETVLTGKADFGPGHEDEVIDWAAVRSRCPSSILPDQLYDACKGRGLEYGEGFQVIRQIEFGQSEVWSRLELPAVWGVNEYRMHPALVDGALQSLFVLGQADQSGGIPFALHEVTSRKPIPSPCYVWARLARSEGNSNRYDVKLATEEGEVVASLRGLMVRRYEQKRGELLYYRPVWTEQALSRPTPVLTGSILLFDEYDRAGREYHEHGLRVVQVKSAPTYSSSPTVVGIRPDVPEDYERLVAETKPQGIVHRWSTAGRALSDALSTGVYSIHLLTRALIRNRASEPLRLLYVYPAGEAVYAAVGAYAKSVRQEQPGVRWKTVGIDSETQEVLAELTEEGGEVRYVGGNREVRKVEEIALAEKATGIRKEGVYLITGGTGGLGRIFAEHLVKHHQTRVVLAGRSELTEEKRAWMAEIGASYVRGDLSDPMGAAEAVRFTRQTCGRLDGVLHAAGELCDGLVWTKSLEDFERVVRAKVRSAQALMEAAGPLDLWVMFSSTAGLLGNAGQSDYAFANACLDGLSRQSQAKNLRIVAINWPLWKAGGMRSGANPNRALELGIDELDNPSGLEIFERILTSGESQIWGCLGNRQRIRSRLLEHSAEKVPVLEQSSGSAPIGQAEVIQYLVRQFAALTKLPLDQIHADEPIENFGIDSVMVAGYARMLEQDLGELSKTLLFEFQTLEKLAGYLLKNHGGRLQRTLRAAVPTGAVEPRDAPARFLPSQVADDVPPSAVRSDLTPDIAIVGVSGRYPMADDLEEFWANLAAGRDCIEEVPLERWDYRDHYHPEPGTAGKTTNKWGGFIRDVDKFDALFFNISPREAQFMDPQERIFLETVWKTVEDAGYRKSELNDRKVGVFVGVWHGQYQLLGVEERLKGNPVSLSSSFSTIANRVSYFFNWHGPSFAVDTMCSSSLTAIHLACEALRRGECELAIAGGVNTTLHPEKELILSQSYFTAKEGRCRSFGAGGDGYVPGEGVGALLLKPLHRALADRDQIHGVIKASALNHGGKTNGYTVPNSKSQAEVIVDALRRAQVSPASISYIEAHGTGTALGDPIEITGLQQAFTEALNAIPGSPTNPPRQFCAIGSVKSNIGHGEAAAGIAGVSKVLLQLKHRKLAPSLHADPVNPNINFTDSFFRVQRNLEDWNPPPHQPDAPRRAGISSFGAGGANAHVIIEEYRTTEKPESFSESGPVIIVLSAKNEDRLREAAGNLARFLEGRIGAGNAGEILARSAFTLQSGREAFEERLALVTSDLRDACDRLREWVSGGSPVTVVRGSARKPTAQIEALRQSGELELLSRRLVTQRALTELSELWVSGAVIDWSGLYPGTTPHRISLPTYPFARQRFWVPESALNGQGTAADGLLDLSASGHSTDRHSNGSELLRLEGVNGKGSLTFETPEDDAARNTVPGFSIMFFSDNSQVTKGGKYQLVQEAARFADEHGFEAIWTPERHFHPFGGIYSSPATLMAALAAITHRIRLRAGSVVLPLEDPLRVVEAWSVVDNLSNGRVDIAFASGWNPNDFVLAPGVYPKLREIWLQRIPEIQRLWRGESTERTNGKNQVVRLRVYPDPIQKELPVWLTASRRPETFVDAGTAGYNVLTMLQGSTVSQLAEKIEQYRAALQAAGHDPKSGKVTLMLHTFVQADATRAQSLVREPFLEYIRSSIDAHKRAFQGGDQMSAEDLAKMAEYSYERYCREASLIGSPATCLEMVRKCREIGVDEIACLVDFGADPQAVIESLPYLEELRRRCLPQRERMLHSRSNGDLTDTARLDASRLGVLDDKSAIRGQFLIPLWPEVSLDAVPPPADSILITYSHQNVLFEHLAEEHQAKHITWICLGTANRELGSQHWEIDAREEKALEGRLKGMKCPNRIYFAGALGGTYSGDELSRLESGQRVGPLAFTALVQAADRLGWMRGGLAIRVLIENAFGIIPGEPIVPHSAALAGLAGSLGKEYPKADIACVDLSALDQENSDALRKVARLVSSEPAQRGTEKVSVRGGIRRQQRLESVQLPEGASRFRRGGNYVILGGAGNVGFSLSQYLARNYNARLVWIGRRPADDAIADRAEAVRRAGGEVLYLQANGENLHEMQGAIEQASRRFGRLNGVIHSALVYQGEFLRKLEPKECERVLNSKTRTSAVLLELVRTLSLDFLLFFGTGQSFFNEARRAVYAAGCCAVDAYGHYIQQQVSFPVRVVNWGFWCHSFDAAMQETLASVGVGVVQPEEGMAAVEAILSTEFIQVAYLKANPEAFARMGVQLSSEPPMAAEEIAGLMAAKLFE